MNFFEKRLMRLAVKGRIPFSRQIMAWSTRRSLRELGAISHTSVELFVPDSTKPIPEEQGGAFGPSHELVPFTPQAVQREDVVGRRIDEVRLNVGSYGMGGLGYWGMRLGEEWLVIALFGASDWLLIDGVDAETIADQGRRTVNGVSEQVTDTVSERLKGKIIADFIIQKNALLFVLEDATLLAIDEDPETRPRFAGTGQLRAFTNEDDLRKVVFLSPTAEIWD
ncbi:MAG: hypothetical protein JJ868_02920 [Shimia sp.]|uniref:hypothetical protein n=1 Tax=Shimia sp. TaxID=1954381 RepID=UPI001B172192|nr:hypothetical protein [Shimia sp.]MBO6896304.1 hypothetical protein [Shimia sp.]